MPRTFATPSSEPGIHFTRGSGTSYFPPRIVVVHGTQTLNALSASGSSRETTINGRNFAFIPISIHQTSPGFGWIIKAFKIFRPNLPWRQKRPVTGRRQIGFRDHEQRAVSLNILGFSNGTVENFAGVGFKLARFKNCHGLKIGQFWPQRQSHFCQFAKAGSWSSNSDETQIPRI